MSKPAIQWQDWRNVATSLDALSMELAEFLALYPDITREQLSSIAGCEIATVNNWFAKGSTHREPTEAHKLRFAIAHWLKNEPAAFKDLRNIMDEL